MKTGYEVYDELRRERGVSQAAVAAATGISGAALTNWGRRGSIPRKKTLQRLADYFDVPIEYFGVDLEGREWRKTENATILKAVADYSEVMAPLCDMYEKTGSVNYALRLMAQCLKTAHTIGWEETSETLKQAEAKYLDEYLGRIRDESGE